MRYDTAIVLGGGRDTNDTLNLRTIDRLRKALELLQAEQFERMILSGGISFSAPPGITRSEASLMRDWLVAQGVAERLLYLEERSTDTLGNAFFSREQLLKPNSWRSALVITSPFHIKRCRYLFQKVLGPAYSVDFAACDDNISATEASRLSKLESHIRDIYARWLDVVSDGDSTAIGKVLFEHHPGHSANPDFTRDEFVKLLYGEPQ